jgi:glycosyltransferase involved in cell wall biosynthesis
MMANSILISVIVISYNSQEYIIETLESIKNQSYGKIELIISDDSSSDSTVAIAEEWIYQNRERFVSCNVVQSKINTGITANCNRGVSEATGEYIKLIAADDLLLENCLIDLIDFTLKKGLFITFSRALPFSETQNHKYLDTKIQDDEISYAYFFSKNQQEQYKALLNLHIPLTLVIGCLIRRDLINKKGGFDEKYEMMEDYPFLIKVSADGQKFELLDKYTIKYRVRPIEDLQSFKTSRRYHAHYKNLKEFRKNEIFPKMKAKKMHGAMCYLFLKMVILQLEYEDNKLFLFGANIGRKLKSAFIKLGTNSQNKLK